MDAAVVICIPVFNDWLSVTRLIARIRDVLAERKVVRIVLVDDGSVECPDLDSLRSMVDGRLEIEIIKLVTNIGHQRAIAVGLSAIAETSGCEVVVVMDGDGEDDPSHIPSLVGEIDKHPIRPVVFARRMRRTESIVFRLGYIAFRVLHWLLTGKGCDVGNYSAIPASWLKRLTYSPDLWNHYAATVIASRLPIAKVPCPRGHRYAGTSKMNVTALVVHGLRAISVFGETVGVRVCAALGLLGLGAFFALTAVVAIRLGTDLAIPGWATNASGLLLVLSGNLLVLAMLSLTFILRARNSPDFIPGRDWSGFVLNWTKIAR